jgi:hypothetical protein
MSSIKTIYRTCTNTARAITLSSALLTVVGSMALAARGWAYAQWEYDAAAGSLKPSSLDPSGVECGCGWHTKVSAQGSIFTAYRKR